MIQVNFSVAKKPAFVYYMRHSVSDNGAFKHDEVMPVRRALWIRPAYKQFFKPVDSFSVVQFFDFIKYLLFQLFSGCFAVVGFQYIFPFYMTVCLFGLSDFHVHLLVFIVVIMVPIIL